jgi:hypothetical protein
VEVLKRIIGLHCEVYIVYGDKRSISGKIHPESMKELIRAGKVQAIPSGT